VTRPAPSFEGTVNDPNKGFDISNSGGELAENDKRREEAYAASRKLQEVSMAATQEYNRWVLCR
jgi:hypothetical protein